jgi:hypothetical protein
MSGFISWRAVASRQLARRGFVRLAGGLVAAATVARPAWACTCAHLTPGAAFKRAGAVFAGTVLETRSVPSPLFHDAAESRVRVEQVLRGDPGAEVIISHGTDVAACGIALDVGDRLLFFTARVIDGRTRTSYCNMLYADQYARQQ